MKIHTAKIRGLWTYTKYDPEKSSGMPQQPEPYCGEWMILGGGNVTPTDKGFRCELIAEIEVEIWESNLQKAEKMAGVVVAELEKRLNCNPHNAPNGWNIAQEEYILLETKQKEIKVTRRHGVTLQWSDVVAPNAYYDHYHLKHGLRMDVLLMAYDQIYAQAMEYAPEQSSREAQNIADDIRRLMNRGSDLQGYSSHHLDGISSADELKLRLQHIILDKNKGNIEEWRNIHHLKYEGAIKLKEPVIIDPRQIEYTSCSFLMHREAKQQGRIEPQLNPVHANAREFIRVNFRPGSTNYIKRHRVELHYGVDGSWWDHIIAIAHPNEPMLRFIQRAERVMKTSILAAKKPQKLLSA